jgi:hypothetical protein
MIQGDICQKSGGRFIFHIQLRAGVDLERSGGLQLSRQMPMPFVGNVERIFSLHDFLLCLRLRFNNELHCKSVDAVTDAAWEAIFYHAYATDDVFFALFVSAKSAVNSHKHGIFRIFLVNSLQYAATPMPAMRRRHDIVFACKAGYRQPVN